MSNVECRSKQIAFRGEEMLSAPLGFSDHEGRHLLRFDFSGASVDATSAAWIPANIQDVSLER